MVGLALCGAAGASNSPSLAHRRKMARVYAQDGLGASTVALNAYSNTGYLIPSLMKAASSRRTVVQHDSLFKVSQYNAAALLSSSVSSLAYARARGELVTKLLTD